MSATRFYAAVGIAMFLSGTGCKRDEPSGGAAGASSSNPLAAPSARVASIGESVLVSGLTWTVVEASDRGQLLPETKEAEAVKTAGRFVMVQFRLVNNRSTEELLSTPDLIDSKGRHFRPHRDQGDHLPPHAETLTLQRAAPGVPGDYWAIYDVAADADDLRVWLTGSPPQQISLGALTESGQPPASPAAAASPRAALDLPKAKAECAKKNRQACATACDGGDHASCVEQADLAWKAGDRAGVVVPLTRACNGDFPRACSVLATRLADERVQPDLTETRRKARRASLATQACEGNDGLGCSTLAKFTADGFGGLTQDSTKAEVLYRKAISALTREFAANDGQSCFLLGMQYDFGKHVSKDMKKAAAL